MKKTRKGEGRGAATSGWVGRAPLRREHLSIVLWTHGLEKPGTY